MTMNSNFVTKRPHKKSRAGCKTCKERKIKCDEARPTCSFCTVRSLPCVYVARAVAATRRSQHFCVTRAPACNYPESLAWKNGAIDSPDPNSSNGSYASSPAASDGHEDMSMAVIPINPQPPVLMAKPLSAIDLQMMHHWSTITFDSLGGKHLLNVTRHVIPELSFSNEFLLNGMLGIAALHKQKLLPQDPDGQRITDMYRVTAMNQFRNAVASIRPGTPGFEAALVMSIFVVVLSSHTNDPLDKEITVVQWFRLYRGLNAIIELQPSVFRAGSVSPMFTRELKPLSIIPSVPTVLMDMLASVPPTDMDYEGLPQYCSMLDALGLLFASLRQDGVGEFLSVRVISWPSYSSDDFARFAAEHRPRALIILSYYLVFVKLVRGIWWVHGIPDRDITAIAAIVGPEYTKYMLNPIKAVQTVDTDAIAKLMLS